ncbi:amylo-alpha-1,6-glucosidase [Sphingomonas sp. HDW15A]|uniref:amylo-alpha-1,6-glucosidase n=1 Tax=Sphingomonas sp. HDW15A TaxID=2714942 RepID=UPI00140B1835|nr:amylo-alpha-1,6-glucosidase [Sphingomonas sp. HDW15A]QIK95360.1 amylo-alpha-1,6-glucosidase [Sphingomonas sp. HDW15A]
MNDHVLKQGLQGEPPPSAPPQEHYHIEATESLVERTLRSLKHNDLFAIFDQQGNFNGGPDGPDGLYYKDTRFLSEMRLRLGDAEPLQLGSVVLDDNGAMAVDLTNADLHSTSGRAWLQRETVHLSRFKFLSDNSSYERLRIHSYSVIGRPVSLALDFDADFADLFEVRGEKRAKRGTRTVRVTSASSVEFGYTGLDGIVRRTKLHFNPPPASLSENRAEWAVDLDEASQQTILISACCTIDESKTEARAVVPAFRAMRSGRTRAQRDRVQISSSNAQFDAVIARAWSDIDMLVTATPYGNYPYAGVPWYSTIFGRDGIITALQMLWAAPYLARGVLTTLSALQATEFDAAADSAPGKILHEMRGGEMAGLGEVPFQRYYGSVDSTPLFVLLAAEYAKRTGDLETIRAIWSNIRAALRWMDEFGDVDGDGFIEYARMTDQGLSNQGWKDSSDSIFHADGRLAQGPIALCEVQAYAFAAKVGAGKLARQLGDQEFGAELERQAEVLRQRFEEAFWVEDLGTYALALDGQKRPCKVMSSNAGHALFAGIAGPERANQISEQLLGSRFFSGWGVRTIASGEARYNPMSYHNGSIWPHDNGLIGLGLARYGCKSGVGTIFEGIFEAATYDELRRLPELFCGFARRRRCGPTSYPVACSPQAWAAATPFALLAASIGCDIRHDADELVLAVPTLPRFLDKLTIRNLAFGESHVDLQLARVDNDVTAAVLSRSGPARVVINK